jgi:quercetin dioxygenase-like cupin family protein
MPPGGALREETLVPCYGIYGKPPTTWAASPDAKVLWGRHRILSCAGVAILAAVVVAMVARAGDPVSSPTPDVAAPAALQAVGHDDPLINVQAVTYQPDQASGWHRHTGSHVVAVVEGALTVLDESCGATVYRPGEAYLGGPEPHLAMNQSNEPVRLVVANIGGPRSGFRTVPIDPPTCSQPAPERDGR